jgi:hypothetical protein
MDTERGKEFMGDISDTPACKWMRWSGKVI